MHCLLTVSIPAQGMNVVFSVDYYSSWVQTAFCSYTYSTIAIMSLCLRFCGTLFCQLSELCTQISGNLIHTYIHTNIQYLYAYICHYIHTLLHLTYYAYIQYFTSLIMHTYHTVPRICTMHVIIYLTYCAYVQYYILHTTYTYVHSYI